MEFPRERGPLGITGRHIPALDGLRATAAWLVVVCHLQWAPRFTNGLGALGVQVFFVISGFLITWLLLSEVAETGDVSLRAFYWRRTRRIFPAFYVVWAVSIVVYICLGISANGREILFSGLYCEDFYMAWAYRTHQTMAWSTAFMSHSWSLGVEEKFYLLWPLCVWILRRHLRVLTGLALALVTAVISYRVLAVAANVDPSALYFSPWPRMDGLMAGCALALLARQGALDGLFVKLAAKPSYAVFVGIALLATQFLSISAKGYAVFGIALQTVLTTVLLVQLIQLAPRSGWRWMDSKPAKFLAGISYSLYLWHFPVAVAVDRVLELHPVARLAGSVSDSLNLDVRSARIVGHLVHGGIKSAAILSLSFMLAVASYYLIERPCLRWRRRPANGVPVLIPDPLSGLVPAPVSHGIPPLGHDG